MASGTKLDRLHGLDVATLESRHSWDACENADGRIIAINDGYSPSDGWLSIREDNRAEVLAVRFDGHEMLTEFGYDIEGSACLTNGPHVHHWVIETPRDNEVDRVRLYVDGVRVNVIRRAGNETLRGDTIDIGTGTRAVAIGRDPTPGQVRTLIGQVYFVALYARALRESEITERALALDRSGR